MNKQNLIDYLSKNFNVIYEDGVPYVKDPRILCMTIEPSDANAILELELELCRQALPPTIELPAYRQNGLLAEMQFLFQKEDSLDILDDDVIEIKNDSITVEIVSSDYYPVPILDSEASAVESAELTGADIDSLTDALTSNDSYENEENDDEPDELEPDIEPEAPKPEDEVNPSKEGESLVELLENARYGITKERFFSDNYVVITLCPYDSTDELASAIGTVVQNLPATLTLCRYSTDSALPDYLLVFEPHEDIYRLDCIAPFLRVQPYFDLAFCEYIPKSILKEGWTVVQAHTPAPLSETSMIDADWALQMKCFGRQLFRSHRT